MSENYHHLPVQGLPSSLLKAEGGTVAAIALMQRKAGLNRDRRRELQTGTKSKWGCGQTVPASISKTDRNVLTFYLSASDRWGSFWHVVRRRAMFGSRTYVRAIDFQLISAYATDWQGLELDIVVLKADCSEWDRIEASLMRFWKKDGKERTALGVFMLWPRLIRDMNSWAVLDGDQKSRIAHAVFSLSSIGWTRWFIDEALSICPDLSNELGELGSRLSSEAESELEVEDSDPLLGDDAGPGNGHAESDVSVESRWGSIGTALSQIQSSWEAQPSISLLQRVVTLAEDASKLLELLREEAISPQLLLETRLKDLRASLDDLATNPEFSWLGIDERNGIMARWRLAMTQALSGDSAAELANDVESAKERLAGAALGLRSARENVERTKREAAALDDEVALQTSAIRRIEFVKRQHQAKEDVIAAERQESEAMLFALAAASPLGEEFDLAADYAMTLANPVVLDEGLAEESTNLPQVESISSEVQEFVQQSEALVGEALSTTEVTQLDSIDTQNAASLDENAHRAPSANAIAVEQGEVAEVVEAETADHEVSHVLNFEEGANEDGGNGFSVQAGDQCRPIWALLERGRPSLAYHFANALHAANPGLRIPPPALLRSVALSPGLIASDGSLALTIGEGFAEIDRAWFEPGETPSNWHTALNLLLIAATLRPMVLAPAMGAAAIAGYRHLSGRYSALLELVRSVGDVSEPLTGFAIGPAVLRSAADEASQKAQLAKLAKEAEDWLVERAPSKKNRYAPASKVWQHWLKPGEAIHNLIAPVARGAIEERHSVRNSAETLANYNSFVALVRDTDRRQLDRRGQDIEAGALDHLWLATCEAVAMAREWLGAESVLSDAGGRLRTLVRQLQSAFDTYAELACAELNEPLADDEWGQVGAASRVLQAEIESIASMFRESEAVPLAELSAKEILARDLLLVPAVSVEDDWTVETGAVELLESLKAWTAVPIEPDEAFSALVKKGNISGALLLMKDLPEVAGTHGQSQLIDRTRDLWIKDLERSIQDARRASEVGLAYGYLSDTERAMSEGELSAVEQRIRETDRFDQALRRVNAVVKKIDDQKDRRIQEARSEFERERTGLTDVVARQVEVPLSRSDIHTFNELMQRVRRGMDPWPERELRRDAFRQFFPTVQVELLSQLMKLELAEVDKLISQGGSIGPISFDLEADAQARRDAEEVYRAWASSVGRRGMHRDYLRKILDALGLVVRSLEQDKVGSGWSLQIAPIVDREVCPVPHFGSRAQGRYRVVVLSDRLTPEDLLQRIGETSQQTATIVFVLSRSPARFWPELARLSKERQRSFLLLDESILLLLLSQRGSRLGTWFDIALPFTYSEPYDASAGFVPAEMFYGRAAELEAVKAQGGCYFIYGGRQLGKTALLRRAERTFLNPTAEHYAVWIDLLAQGIGERRPAADVWLSVSDKLKELRIPGLELPSINPSRPSTIDAFLASIKAFLVERPGRRILLLLDEADHFFEQDARHAGAYAETRRLKELMDETDRRFKVVFAGLHNVLRTASTSNQPLGHLNEAVRIGPLMDEREIRAAEELITRPIEAAGYEFEDRSLVMRILAQTNYYPSLIQLYCTQLLRHLRETKLRRREVLGPRFNIMEADIETVFSGRPLRDAIRSKFRLTLQLDDRYEVIAYAIGLEALSQGYDHAQGIDWRTIRQECATLWWPEGFATTSERDFLALLEEMVELGVLSQAAGSERFSLRNPNVLLLLGSQQEIENTLQATREPKIEFESTIFRPTLGGRVDSPARNPLTYRQLDEVVQMRNSVSLVAANAASGGDNLLRGLRDQPGMKDSRQFVNLERAIDKRNFTLELDKEINRRVKDGITVMFVPSSAPWNLEWVRAAKSKIRALKSNSSFVSVVFVADPERLWELSESLSPGEEWADAWLSVLPWSRGFVRKWLEELQLPIDAVERLQSLTGFWGGLLESAAHAKGAVEFASNLDQMSAHFSNTAWLVDNRRRLTGGIERAEAVLKALVDLGDSVSENDLVEFGDLSHGIVARALRWAEPLGLVVRHPGGTWALDSFARQMLRDLD